MSDQNDDTKSNNSYTESNNAIAVPTKPNQPPSLSGGKLYKFRNQFVMLDSDLADYYGTTTKRVNESVRRNPLRFPIDMFMFQLSDQEMNLLRSQIATAKNNEAKRRYNPYVFTLQGALTLASVLKSPQADRASVQLAQDYVVLLEQRSQHPELFPKLDSEVPQLVSDYRLTVINNFHGANATQNNGCTFNGDYNSTISQRVIQEIESLENELPAGDKFQPILTEFSALKDAINKKASKGIIQSIMDRIKSSKIEAGLDVGQKIFKVIEFVTTAYDLYSKVSG